ncbi:hypothetical protein B0J12DRAFT_557654, partial [Macrophomina phaseolina]
DIELVQRRLQRWKGVCLVCRAAGREDQHSVSRCRTEQGRQAEMERREIQGRIVFERYSGCFHCGVPQELCGRWESNRKGGFRRVGGECQFFGVMLGVLYGIKHGYPAVWQRWEQRLRGAGIDVESEGVVMQYLGRRWKEGEVESNKLVWEFLWITGRVE